MMGGVGRAPGAAGNPKHFNNDQSHLPVGMGGSSVARALRLSVLADRIQAFQNPPLEAPGSNLEGHRHQVGLQSINR